MLGARKLQRPYTRRITLKVGWGIAWAAGVPVWGVAGPDERPGVMLKGCVTKWFPTLEALMDQLTRWRGW